MLVKPISVFLFPTAKRGYDTMHVSIMQRQWRADHLLVENIRILLMDRRLDDGALAIWCGHKPAWISKILSLERGIPVKELGKIADFFGLTVSQLFQPGISPLTERRKHPRRSGVERRSGRDRRGQERSAVHPEVNPFPPHRDSKVLRLKEAREHNKTK